MNFLFEADVVEWRGPAPFVFAVIPPDESAEIKLVSNRVTYGWGCIPVVATIGSTTYTTSLFPRGDVYYLPVKVKVQRAEGISVGDHVQVQMEFGTASGKPI